MLYFLTLCFSSFLFCGLIITFFIVYYQEPKANRIEEVEKLRMSFTRYLEKEKNTNKEEDGDMHRVNGSGELVPAFDFDLVRDAIDSCINKDQLETAYNLLERYKAKHGRTELYYELEADYNGKMVNWIGV